MPNLNKVFLMGHLGRDPEVKYLPSGTAIADFSIAVSESYKKNGETQKETTWLNITFFGARAEAIGNYFNKGDPIFVEGKIRIESWEDSEGNKKYKTKIIGYDFKFLKGKGDNTAKADNANTSEDNEDGEIPF